MGFRPVAQLYLLFFRGQPHSNTIRGANSNQRGIIIFKLHRVLFRAHSWSKYLLQGLGGRFTKHIFNCTHVNFVVFEDILDDFAAYVARHNHELLHICAILACVVTSLIKVRFLICPIAELNRHNLRILVVVSDALHIFREFTRVDYNELPARMSIRHVVGTFRVDVNARDRIIDELLATFFMDAMCLLSTQIVSKKHPCTRSHHK